MLARRAHAASLSAGGAVTTAGNSRHAADQLPSGLSAMPSHLCRACICSPSSKGRGRRPRADKPAPAEVSGRPHKYGSKHGRHEGFFKIDPVLSRVPRLCDRKITT